MEKSGRPRISEAEKVAELKKKDLGSDAGADLGDAAPVAEVFTPESLVARLPITFDVARMVVNILDAPGGEELARALAFLEETRTESMRMARATALRLMTAPEVQTALRLPDIKAVYTMVRVGKLPAVKVGKRLLFARKTVEKVATDLESLPARPVLGGGVDAAKLGPTPPPIKAATRGRVLRRLPLPADKLHLLAHSDLPSAPFASAPLLHGSHTRFACAELRQAYPANPTAPVEEDGVCKDPACPLARSMGKPAATAPDRARYETKAEADARGAMFCEHANEVPTGACPCPPSCYCAGRTCTTGYTGSR